MELTQTQTQLGKCKYPDTDPVPFALENSGKGDRLAPMKKNSARASARAQRCTTTIQLVALHFLHPSREVTQPSPTLQVWPHSQRKLLFS